MDGIIDPRDFGFLYRIVKDGSQEYKFLGDAESIKRLQNLGFVQVLDSSYPLFAGQTSCEATPEGVFYVRSCLERIPLYSSVDSVNN